MAKACLRPIRMITERPNIRKLPVQIFRQETALLHELVTELIGPDFNTDKVDDYVSKLGELDCPRSDIASWVLTCLAFNAALGPDHAGSDWNTCRDKWVKACTEFGIPLVAIREAESFGINFRGAVYRRSKQKQELAMRAIYNYFFENPKNDILTEIDGIKDEE